ncbi:MAG: hypothetical protein WD342_06500 [Verrucomicrobiales bacterium]
MTKTRKDKVAAVEAIRHQLGSRITSGGELLKLHETREARAATGMRGLNEQLGGGLPRGQLTEIIAPGVSQGGGLVMAELLAQARRERRYAMLFDVGRGFTPECVPESDLESLLWVGCESAQQAVEALDIASRDENFQLFLLDLRDCEPSDWRAVKSNQWYRVLGQLRPREAVTVIFAREAVTSASKHRLAVDADLSLDSLDRERAALIEGSRFEPLAFPDPNWNELRQPTAARCAG